MRSTTPIAPIAGAETGDLRYELQEGYLHAWLVAGPSQTPVADLHSYHGDHFKAQIARAYYREPDLAALSPAEGRSFQSIDAQGVTHTLPWNLIRPSDDHYVNLSGFYHTCHYLVAWAYAKIVTPTAQSLTLTLTSSRPADLWLNGQHVHRQEHAAQQRPPSVTFPATLQAGENEVLVRLEAVAVRNTPFLLALQLEPAAAQGCYVHLPTTRLPLARRQKLERVFDQAYVKQSVYQRNEQLEIFWPQEMALVDRVTVRLQAANGRIYGEGQRDVTAGTKINFGAVYQLPDGDYDAVIMPALEEYYLHKMQVERRIPLRIVNGKYAETPFGTLEERRQEALLHAANSDLNLYAEIARMALGDWQHLRQDAIYHEIERVNRRVDCADFQMVGLLGMLTRYGDDPNFPAALRNDIIQCALNFRYWLDEPGDDAMCFWTENHQILFHTCQLLAGQLFPQARFGNNEQSGAWHQAKGQQRALSWLRKRARGGFREWDSNCYFNENVLALAHLADLAVDNTLAEMAAVVLDKLAFTMAINSFNGVFGSTHGRSYSALILGGRNERTAGISRLLWGQGTLNNHLTGVVALASARSYELPPILAAIATDQPSQLWNRERHAGQGELWCDLNDKPWEINKVTYKTPDYMLCSAQDYHPGEPGADQHIWQATLGPDAVVFTNHPVCVSTENDLRPNFWSGNGVLPRVAQWQATLIALYQLPEDDWMGFTHAYLPVAAYDEVELHDGWAFARKGNGYVALTAANGLHLLERGSWAYREIRSPGLHNVWLCQMGRRAEDGDFADFQAAILARPPHYDELAVRFTNLRGEEIAFAWQGPLQIEGRDQPISGFRHYDNPYCQTDLPCEEMIIQYQQEQMRLDFAIDQQVDAQEAAGG